MRILIGHNRYQHAGGEDTVVRFEIDLLRRNGHEVFVLEADNREFNQLSIPGKIRNISSWSWSQDYYDKVKEICRTFEPDIAHFHNTFYMMTPSVYYACRQSGVPVVQTLHNFRWLCSNALFFRDGHACEDCLKFSLMRGVIHRCYHGSALLTSAVVKMLNDHRQKGTWNTMIDAYIALSKFSQGKFIEGGLPADKIFVKGNTMLLEIAHEQHPEDYCVFAGRLSSEKGIMTLLQAFKKVKSGSLVILGSGEEETAVRTYIESHRLNNVHLKGFLQGQEYLNVLKKARFLVLPSICYENFPMSILEAFALSVPVIVSRHGSMVEMVNESVTGSFFTPGHVDELALRINEAFANPTRTQEMGRQARLKFERDFSPQKNYEQLIYIYQKVLSS